MQEIILECKKRARGKYLRIAHVTVEWDGERKAFAAMVMFHRTRDRLDSRPLGSILYANNVETLAKMLQEYNLLYPVREEMVIGTRSRDVIAAKMLEYNKAGGKVLAGLAKRRAAEQGLFLTPIQAKTKADWNKGQYGYWWQDEDGSWPANEWRLINHHYYLFNRDGYMVTGWHRWDGQTCDPDDGSGDWYFLDNTSGGELEGACWHGRENGSLEIWYVD